MKNVSKLLDEAVYAGNLSKNEEEEFYSWVESLILAKRKADEYEAKAKAFDDISRIYDENTGLGEHDEDLINLDTLVGEIGTIIEEFESEEGNE